MLVGLAVDEAAQCTNPDDSVKRVGREVKTLEQNKLGYVVEDREGQDGQQ